MPHRVVKLLHDIRDAGEFILTQTEGHSLEEYETKRVMNAAVERNFIIIGEAFTRLARIDENTAKSLGAFPQVIGFRNIVDHGYDVIEHAIVWGIIQNEGPKLLAAVEAAIAERREEG